MIDWSHAIEQYEPIVLRTIRRHVRNEDDVVDCIQQTFLSAFVYAQTNEILNWDALLTDFATARAIDCYRRRRREADRLTTIPEGGIVDTSRAIQPVDAAEVNEAAESLRAAVADLEDLKAKVFCLANLEGLSHQVIAEQLGLSVNNVSVLLCRARKILRERMIAFKPGGLREEVKP